MREVSTQKAGMTRVLCVRYLHSRITRHVVLNSRKPNVFLGSSCRLEDSNSKCNKLQHTLKLKEKKIEALESSLLEVESASSVQKDDKMTVIKRTVETKDNRIVELESR